MTNKIRSLFKLKPFLRRNGGIVNVIRSLSTEWPREKIVPKLAEVPEECPVCSHNEWDPLEEVIVGRVEGTKILSKHSLKTTQQLNFIRRIYFNRICI